MSVANTPLHFSQYGRECDKCKATLGTFQTYTAHLRTFEDSPNKCTHLKSLGAAGTKYVYDKPTPELLERFAAPKSTTAVLGAQDTYEMTIDIRAPEFTSLCPITGQPDFATIVISYIPDKWCVESKSLKLYLGSYRMHGDFHEACVQRICDDLVALLEPHGISVKGEFTPRGGIPFWPTVTWEKM